MPHVINGFAHVSEQITFALFSFPFFSPNRATRMFSLLSAILACWKSTLEVNVRESPSWITLPFKSNIGCSGKSGVLIEVIGGVPNLSKRFFDASRI